MMKLRSQLLLEKAIAAMVSAIEIYNTPAFQYREEAFSILTVNGWELLLKAKWLVENDDKLESLYIEHKKKDAMKSQGKNFLLNRSGNPRTSDVGFLAKKLVEKKHITQNVWTNIQALLIIRDNAIHFYNPSMEIANKLQILGAASVQNFVSLVKKWFDNDLSEFNLHLMPLSFVTLPTQTEAVVFNREEQFLQKYSWDYKKLTDQCRARYSEFKCDKKFHGIKKSLCQDERNGLCKIHYMDPRNEKSSKRQFYKPDILRAFDKHYTKAAS